MFVVTISTSLYQFTPQVKSRYSEQCKVCPIALNIDEFDPSELWVWNETHHLLIRRSGNPTFPRSRLQVSLDEAAESRVASNVFAGLWQCLHAHSAYIAWKDLLEYVWRDELVQKY